MNKSKTFMLLFSSICNGACVFIGILCLCLLTNALTTQMLISSAVVLSLVGLIAIVVLSYFSSIPITGNNRKELKESTPIVPKMHKYRAVVYYAIFLISTIVAFSLMTAEVIDKDKKQAAAEYLTDNDYIDSAALFYVVPDMFLEKACSSALLVKEGKMLQENPDSVELQKSHEEVATYYDDVNSAHSLRTGAMFVCLALSGFFLTVIKLRINYVIALKEVGER